jgi:Putative adhesin
MSSPISTPPIPPSAPPPPRRRHSFAGPVVLILVGLIFLLGNLHLISWARLGHLFANYWAVLLILWGIIKLVEHQRAQREGVRAPGIGVGGVFLAIMIVVCGLIATHVERFHWSELRDQINIDDDDFSNMFGETYNFDDHLAQAFPGGASLKVINNHGAVSVHASDDQQITLVVRKRIGADNQGDADKYNQKTKPTITTIGGLVTLDTKVEAAGDHPVESDLDISVPRKVPVSIVSRRGDVTVVDRDGNVDISSQHSDTSVENVNGNVKVTQEKGSVKVQQVTGEVHIEGRVNETTVADVKGSVQLDGEFQESVKLSRITKTVTFKSSRTDMEFSRIDGDLDLDSDELHAEAVTGPLHLSTRSKNIRLVDVSGDLRLQDDNGSIEVGMRTLGNVQIDNRSGSIQLSLPEKAGFRLDARTREGEIQSDFAELKIENNDRESKASGTVGNGAAHIVLNNEHDGIEIRRGAVNGGPKEGVTGGINGGVPGAKQSKGGKSLPAPKEKVEPTEN